jgi:hypothetical protein
MQKVDVILFEGLRSAALPMIEVHRPSLGLPMLGLPVSLFWPSPAMLGPLSPAGA